jgi:hypothetical protein
MPIEELLDKMLLNSLVYYKNYLNNLDVFYSEIEIPFSVICNDIYLESDNLVLYMQKMLRILYNIIEKELYNHQAIILKKFKAITDEYSHFKDIFVKFKNIIGKINKFNNEIENKIDKFNKLNKQIDSQDIIFFNNENLSKYILENNIDLEDFKESKKIIKEILNEHDKIINKLNS